MGIDCFISIYTWNNETKKYDKETLKEPLFKVSPAYEKLIMFFRTISNEGKGLNEDGVGELEIDFGLFMESLEDYRWNKDECEIIISLVKQHQELFNNLDHDDGKFLGLSFQKEMVE